jgi:fructose-bisphosphate aldolase class 1
MPEQIPLKETPHKPIDAFRDALPCAIRGSIADLRGEPFGADTPERQRRLQHMKNLKDDTQKFRSSFNSALSKSTIRKTTQEKDAKTLAQNFEKQTNSMYEAFEKSAKAEPYLQNCRDTARQIDKS